MFRKTKIYSGLMLAFSGTLTLGSLPAFGQQQLDRVEITGSSVRRIDGESALPVTVLKKEDIERSGATSTVDLLKKLTSVQGSTGESASVGGATFGFSGVSIHNVGETRTLVLLNGHRLSLFGGQTLTGFAAGFDLNAIPVSAIERVEILLDGASALYGADAIAGVVNFITKKDTTEGDITVGYSAPHGGAKEKRISATKGFGSLEKDGYNVVASFGHDERTKLDSTKRSFASSGKLFFQNNGQNYRLQQASASTIPANVTDNNGNLVNPYLIKNGTCAPKSFRIIDGSDDYCGFDFVGELEIYPTRKRDSAVVSGQLKVAEQTLFAEILWSKTSQTSRIAPVPGGISIAAGSPLANQYLVPVGITEDSTAFYRLYDLGKRASEDSAKFYDIALGSKGTLANWDYTATYTHSQSDVKSNISGYPGALAVAALRSSGLVDPFVGPGEQSAAAATAIQNANYKGYWDGGVAKLDTLQVTGSRELFNLPAGPAMLGLGANFNKENYQSKPSLFAQGLLSDPVAGTLCDPTGANASLPCDQRFGDAAATPAYTATRRSYGVFGELGIPVIKGLDFTLSARYDHFSDFGSATTGKASFKWQPATNFLIRGSVGNGFHAPTVPQVAAAPQPFGVTSDKYACTAGLAAVAAAQGATCRPGSQQYDVLAAGNKLLKPEKSKQATIGFRFEPTSSLTVGADLWHVQIRQAFGTLAEATVFANPEAFPGSWSKVTDVGTGATYLAFNNGNANLGKSFATGLDLDGTFRTKTDFGDLTTQLTMTYMIREKSQLEADGPYYSAIGNNAELGTVTFRWQGRLATSLRTGNWTNTLIANFKSGYKDAETTVDVLDNAGNVVGSQDIRLDVATWTTLDFQTAWNMRKDLTLTAGMLNLLNKTPPLSLALGGINKGQQFGYDDRYYDSRGRTAYVNLSYKF
ncbi:TonB-dependent receptor [soil metagenome]